MQENEIKDPKESPLYSEFAYDDAFRTMETECDDIVIPFVNYFYDEHFTKNAVITRLRNEHFIEHQDQSDEMRITDSHFRISENDISKSYHLECESKPYDNSFLFKIFEYDSQMVLDKLLPHDVIIRLTGKVIYKLTMNHSKVQEKVGGLMGGKVLDLPEVRVFHEGMALGEAKGEAIGEAKGEKERKRLEDEIVALREEIESLKKELNK